MCIRDSVKGFYKNIGGGRAGVTEYYMYDATNLRLREVSLNYTFPKKWMQKTKVLKDLQLAFVARKDVYKRQSLLFFSFSYRASYLCKTRILFDFDSPT